MRCYHKLEVMSASCELARDCVVVLKPLTYPLTQDAVWLLFLLTLIEMDARGDC